MFTTVHSTRASLLLLVCALLFLSALPTVVRSQEENTPTSETTDETASNSEESVKPYATEIIQVTDTIVGDFVVGPGKVDIAILPGESRTIEMTVTNRTGERRKFNFTVEDATGSDNLEQPIVLLGETRGPYSLKDYVSIPHMNFELDQGERARIPVTITIPEDAEAGGLYGSVLVETATIEDTNTTESNAAPRSVIVARIGTLFFITVPGDIEREGALKKFSTIPEKTYFESGSINFGILFENTGPIHLAPYGELRIVNMLHEEVGFIELEPWFALPKSLRLREVSWNRELLFGRYTATALINRSYDDVVDTMEYTFWVLPWKIVVGGFAVVFITLFLIRAFFRSFEFKRKSR